MTIKTKIYPPFSILNELESNYKIVIWKNATQRAVQFTPTKKQALEIERRFKKQFR